jgi:signal transduction histidine kinase
LETKIAREREMFAQQLATQLGKANKALREFLDALAAVPDLDRFLGQVMAVITGQLGADSSVLRLRNSEHKSLNVEFVFQNGRAVSPAEAQYPEALRSLAEGQFASLEEPLSVYQVADSQSGIPDDHRLYLLGLGVKTLLAIPLVSLGQEIGLLTFRFTKDRVFQPEELEIARALATQSCLAIELARLAETARQSAVLQERNRLAGEIHDSLAQSFAGISLQLGMAQEAILNKDDSCLSYVERASDLACFGLAEARFSTMTLRPIMEEAGLVEALRMLGERSNIPGKLRKSSIGSAEPYSQSKRQRIRHGDQQRNQ